MYRYEENSSGLEYLLTALDLVSIREISSSKAGRVSTGYPIIPEALLSLHRIRKYCPFSITWA
ncbi:hypothetical protein, partial [Blautia wexlerae]|uniref:hypothetical protein n=1 Tax=Blautia wexlerae TaxID=418240 RepID=UPI0022E283D3